MRRVILASLVLVACDLRPSDRLQPAAGTAALAVRDHVVAWQEWGTAAHTVPFLERAYGTAIYLEESSAMGRAAHHQAVRAALQDLLASHEAVDLFILVHGNDYARVVATIEPELRARLRLVYSTGAGELREADAWLRLGAGAYVGHPGGNIAPLFYAHFLPRWLEGASVEDAVAGANADTRSELFSAPVQVAFQVGSWVGGSASPEALWAGTRAGVRGDARLRSKP